MMLEIGWKSYENRCWPCFEVIENLSASSVIFESRRKIFGNLWKLLEIFGNLWKSSEIFGNLRKPSVNLRKFRCCEDKKFSRILLKKSWQVYLMVYRRGPVDGIQHV